MGWPVQVVDATGSTNADLVARARSGDSGPGVLVARSQTAGRGRLGRSWQSPPGTSLSMSMLWTPAVPQPGWTWLPMVTGLGVLDALSALGVDARLKWPNDVVVPVPRAPRDPDGSAQQPTGALTGLAKLAGILVEVAPGPVGPAVVAGVGLNLRPPVQELGVPVASLSGLLAGGAPAFVVVVDTLAAALQQRLTGWERASGGDGAADLRREYLRVCSTVGRTVRVTTPGGVSTGQAVDVDAGGALVLATGDGLARVSAGDVEHVR